MVCLRTKYSEHLHKQCFNKRAPYGINALPNADTLAQRLVFAQGPVSAPDLLTKILTHIVTVAWVPARVGLLGYVEA